jgi:amino acid permease
MEKGGTMRYLVVTVVFLVATFLLAISVRDLSIVLEVVGATGSTTVVCLVPGAVFYRLHSSRWRYVAAAQVCIGLIIIPTCLSITFLKAM